MIIKIKSFFTILKFKEQRFSVQAALKNKKEQILKVIQNIPLIEERFGVRFSAISFDRLCGDFHFIFKYRGKPLEAPAFTIFGINLTRLIFKEPINTSHGFLVTVAPSGHIVIDQMKEIGTPSKKVSQDIKAITLPELKRNLKLIR